MHPLKGRYRASALHEIPPKLWVARIIYPYFRKEEMGSEWEMQHHTANGKAIATMITMTPM